MSTDTKEPAVQIGDVWQSNGPLAESLDPPCDDAYAERSDDFGSVDDPYPDDFRDYYRMVELEGAL